MRIRRDMEQTMIPERYRQGKRFMKRDDKGHLVVAEEFPSINAAKRANRVFGYPTIPDEDEVRAKRYRLNSGRRG